MNSTVVVVNGQVIETIVPCTLEQFLLAQKLHPRSVVVELNGEVIVPSEFTRCLVSDGDRLEVVQVVAGG